MNSLPTVAEYSTSLLDQCQTLLYNIEKRNLDMNDKVQSIHKSATLLIHALDISSKERSKLLKKLDANNIKSMVNTHTVFLQINMQINH